MTRRIPRTASAALFATMLLMASALPAAAAKIQGEGYYARYQGTPADGQGMVIVDQVDANSGRLNALLIGLVAGEEYAIVGRSIGCSGTPTNANRVFSALKVADTDGEAVVSNMVLGLTEGLVSSIWIGRTDGGEPATCQFSLNFEEIKVNVVGDYNGDGAAGAAAHEYGHVLMVVEKRPNGKARVTIVADGLSGNDVFRFTGVNKGCGKSNAQGFFTVEFAEGRVSNFKSKTVNMTQNQLDALRSVRIRNVTDGANVGCAPLSIIAILVG